MLSVPGWFDIRFLHPSLRQALIEKLEPKDQEDLAAMLTPLGVTRYSLDNVLGALVAQTNRRAVVEPDKDETEAQGGAPNGEEPYQMDPI